MHAKKKIIPENMRFDF